MTRAGRPRAEHALRYQLRLHPEQLEAYRAAAELDGRDLQNWIRWTLDRAARPARGKKEQDRP